MHRRTGPRTHRFAYRVFFLRVAVHELKVKTRMSLTLGIFGINRPGWLSFQAKDHGDGDGDLHGWISQLLAKNNITADGEIWLHTFSRVLGYQFKPVSFWFCHNRAKQLVAVLAEVNNTFGERHLYLLSQPQHILHWGQTLHAEKAFHVSPFFHVRGNYEFRFFNNQQRGVARIDYYEQDGLALCTSLSGEFAPINAKTIGRAALTYPLFSIAVMIRIHWHALRLWAQKRIAYVPKPNPPQNSVTKGQP